MACWQLGGLFFLKTMPQMHSGQLWYSLRMCHPSRQRTSPCHLCAPPMPRQRNWPREASTSPFRRGCMDHRPLSGLLLLPRRGIGNAHTARIATSLWRRPLGKAGSMETGAAREHRRRCGQHPARRRCFGQRSRATAGAMSGQPQPEHPSGEGTARRPRRNRRAPVRATHH